MRNPTVTESMAQRGDAPPPLTRAQWDAMHAATADYPGPAQWMYGNAGAYRDSWSTALWRRGGEG